MVSISDSVSSTHDNKSSAILFHAVSMTLIMFIGFPTLICMFIKWKPENKSSFRFAQTAIVTVIICIGTYGSYRFSTHLSVHAVLGMVIIWLLLPIWSLTQYVHSIETLCIDQYDLQSIRKWLSLFLLLFLFPTEWIIGLQHFTQSMTHHYGVIHPWGPFMGHYGPAYIYTVSGIGIIWNHNKINNILKGEFNVMIIAAMLEMTGEFVNNWGNLDNPHVWHHVLLDVAAIMLGSLCLLFHKLKVF